MKKIFIALVLLASSVQFQTVQAQTEWDQFQHSNRAMYCDAYPYFTLGVGPVLIIPNVGVGYRGHYFNNGFDVSLSISTFGVVHQIQGMVGYQFYPNPFRMDPWYVGLGVAPTFYIGNEGQTGFSIAPDICVGKERITTSGEKHFLEVHVQAPTWGRYSRLDFPMMYVKYGVSF